MGWLPCAATLSLLWWNTLVTELSVVEVRSKEFELHEAMLDPSIMRWFSLPCNFS